MLYSLCAGGVFIDLGQESAGKRDGKHYRGGWNPLPLTFSTSNYSWLARMLQNAMRPNLGGRIYRLGRWGTCPGEGESGALYMQHSGEVAVRRAGGTP